MIDIKDEKVKKKEVEAALWKKKKREEATARKTASLPPSFHSVAAESLLLLNTVRSFAGPPPHKETATSLGLGLGALNDTHLREHCFSKEHSRPTSLMV